MCLMVQIKAVSLIDVQVHSARLAIGHALSLCVLRCPAMDAVFLLSMVTRKMKQCCCWLVRNSWTIPTLRRRLIECDIRKLTNHICLEVCPAKVVAAWNGIRMLLSVHLEHEEGVDCSHIDHVQENTLPKFSGAAQSAVRRSSLIKGVDTSHFLVVVVHTLGLLNVDLHVVTVNLGVSADHNTVIATMNSGQHGNHSPIFPLLHQDITSSHIAGCSSLGLLFKKLGVSFQLCREPSPIGAQCANKMYASLKQTCGKGMGGIKVVSEEDVCLMRETFCEPKHNILGETIAVTMLTSVQLKVEKDTSFSIAGRKDLEPPFHWLLWEVLLED